MSPNVFLAFQITNPELIKNLRKAHFNCVMKDNRLKDFITPLETAHVTLNVFRVESERLEEAKVIIQEVFKANIEQLKPEGPVSFQGLGMFGKTVLFAKPNTGIEFLQRAHDIFKEALGKNNFDLTGHGSYNPHVTLFQVRGAAGNSLKEIPRQCFEDMEEMEFGSQEVEEIQFLSMTKEKDSSGYFYSEDSYNLGV